MEFRDTDAAGIAHFSVFFNYMEETEHEFLRSLSLSVSMQDEQGTLSWPRVAASCDYVGAVGFEDRIDIELRIARLGTKSVTYAFRMRHEGRCVAEGRITAVCCRLERSAPPRSVPIPAHIAAALRAYVSDPDAA